MQRSESITRLLVSYRSAAFSTENQLIAGLAAFVLLFHLLANAFTPYGYFRDELYYLACSHHLAAGYVDHPPLSVLVLALVRTLLGDSLFALRLMPALAVSGTVVFTGLLVRQMKGRSWAVVLAGLSVVQAPIFLAMGTFYSMNSLDMLLWSVAAYLVLRLVEKPTQRRWAGLGIVMGLALLNKISFLWFGAGWFVGILLIAPLREQLRTPGPYLAGGITFLLFLPFIIWNIQHNFAHLEFMHNAVQNKYGGISRTDFLQGALLMMNPLTPPVWGAGLYYYFRVPRGRRYRVLGIIFLVTLLILLLNGHSKPEYLASAFPLLLAGGGVWLEQIATRRSWHWLPVAITVLLVPSLALAPLVVPLLPPATYVQYAAALRFSIKNSEGKETAALPQFFADMFGWEELAAHVSAVYRHLPPAERAQAVVYAQNYGEAAALEHYRKQYALPPVTSGHNTYWLWGYGTDELQVMIIVGGEREDHLRSFEQVDSVAVHRAAYVMPYENNLPIFVCRYPRTPAAEIWSETKHYN